MELAKKSDPCPESTTFNISNIFLCKTKCRFIVFLHYYKSELSPTSEVHEEISKKMDLRLKHKVHKVGIIKQYDLCHAMSIKKFFQDNFFN